MKYQTLRKTSSKILLVLAVQSGISMMSFPNDMFVVKADSTGEYNYTPDYKDYDETEAAAAKLNIELASEGSVLLKNNENCLPMAKSTKVTVLGSTADTLCIGGAGSGGLHKPGGKDTPLTSVDIYESLDKAGFEVNPQAKAAYALPANAPKADDYNADALVEGGHYMEKLTAATADSVEFDGQHYAPLASGSGTLDGVEVGDYKTALVVLTRWGAEGADNKGTSLSNQEDETHHQMELDKSERELLAYAKKNFSKIVVVLNSPCAMQIGNLKDDAAIDSILWIGTPGWNGIMALGQILNGTVNPSGRTVDLYARDLRKDPTFYNFGDYSQANLIINGQTTNDDLGIKLKSAVSMTYDAAYLSEGVKNSNSVVIDYAEGIYVGYKYFETVYAELLAKAGKDKADAWWNEAVAYPFGYGLSYSTFKQEITKISHTTLSGKEEVEVTVKVTNTGKVAGKEVVQLYNEAPYEEGGIEKSAVAFVGFEKTEMLEPGKSQEVVITVDAKDLASFDYDDRNDNGHNGYELEKGTYKLSVRNNSHEVLDSKDLTVSETVKYNEDNDDSTPNNIFSQKENEWAAYNTSSKDWTVKGTDHELHRDDMLTEDNEVALEEEYSNGNPNELQAKLGWLVGSDVEDRTFKKEAFQYIGTQEGTGSRAGAAYDYDNKLTAEVETNYNNLWAKKASDIPSTWTQGTGVGPYYAIQLADMQGVPLDDPRWDEFMNQLTWEEIVNICNDGGFGAEAIDTIGKPHMESHDGPGQLRCQWNTTEDGNGWGWVSETVIASTFNKRLAYQEGVMVGNESLFLGVSGWYGPGSNIHRSQLSGRNFEYYSSDGVHAGLMLAEVVKGARSKGVHTVMKHLFLNDQETSRSGAATFANEQAIREIYAKPFEIAVKEGGANGYMTSFNRIGCQYSTSYAIVNQMYINEWGFDGIGITDAYATGSGWDSNSLIRGVSLPLNMRMGFGGGAKIDGTWDASLREGQGGVKVDGTESATQYYWARETAKRTLHTYSEVNNMRGIYSANMLHPTEVGLVNGKSYTNYALFSEYEMADFQETMLDVYGDTSKYEFTVTGLPEGITFDKTTGTISGTATIPGSYTVNLSVKGVGAVGALTAKDVDVTINVIDTVKTGAINIKPVGGYVLNEDTYVENYDMSLAAGWFWMDLSCQGKAIAVNYASTGLPEGLTMDAKTGAITGTIPEGTTGVIKAHVTQTVTMANSAFFNSFLNMMGTDIYEYDVILQIEGTQISVEQVNVDKFSQGQVVTLVSNNGEVQRVLINAVSGPQGEKGEKGDKGDKGDTGATGAAGANGADGAKGETGVGVAKIELVDGNYVFTMTDGTKQTVAAPASEKSGCGGSATAAAGLGLAALAGALFLAKKRKEEE